MNRSVLLSATVTTLALSLMAVHAQETEGSPEEVETGQGAETGLPVDATETSEGNGEAEVENSAILPNAEDHEESEAATMDMECGEDPDNCLDPLTGPVTGPERSSPENVDTPDVEAE